MRRALARRLLRTFVPDGDGDAIVGDLDEELARRSVGGPRARLWLWFWWQVGSACLYGLGDRIRDAALVARKTPIWEGMRSDTRAAVRSAWRHPHVWVPLQLLIALGIGLNTALFSVVRATLLAPLPYPEPDELRVLVGTSAPLGWRRASLSIPEIRDYQDRAPALGEIGIFRTGLRLSLGDASGPVPVRVGLATSGVFRLLDVAPELGRTFTRSEDDPTTSPRVAVVSHGFWLERLGADPAPLGRTVELSGTRYRVVGVMPATFDGLSGPGRAEAMAGGPDLWLPLGSGRPYLGSEMFETRLGRQYYGVLRVAQPGNDHDLQVVLDRVAAEQEREYPESHLGRGTRALSVRDLYFGHLAGAIRLLMAGALIVLAICCVNVAVLLLLQGSRRRGELALRLALGARRSLVVRHLIIEAALLAASGGALGIAFAWVSLQVLHVTLSPPLMPSGGIGLDTVTLTACVAAVALTGLVFGALPALFGTAPERLSRGRTPRGTPPDHAGSWRWAQALVLTEVAIAVVLLVGAGMATRTLSAVVATPLGFDPTRLIAIGVEFSSPVPPSDDARMAWQFRERAMRDRAEFVDRFLSRAHTLASVEGVVFFGPHPLDRLQWHRFLTPDWSDPSVLSNRTLGRDMQVTPGAFELLGVPILAGRDFTPEDRMGARRVAIVDRDVAESLWPGSDPIGRIFYSGFTREFGFTVVGVVETAAHAGRWRTPEELAGDVFVPYRLVPRRFATIVARVRSGMGDAGDDLRLLAHELWPDAVLFDPVPMDRLVARHEAVPRLTTLLMATYAAIAGILAIAGVYGVVALTARGRQREVALRAALGARRPRLIGMTLVQGALPVTLGLTLGLFGARVSGRVADGLFEGMAAADGQVYALVTALVLVAGLVASAVPAFRVVTSPLMRTLGTE